MTDAAVTTIKKLLDDGVKQHVFSMAAAAWISDKTTPFTAPSTQSSGAASIFDLASITKIFTASACLRLVSKDVLSLDTPLIAHMPELSGSRIGAATIEQVLRHRAGFAAWHPFFEALPVEKRGNRNAESFIINKIIAHPPATDPGQKTIYSDLGYILIAHILERITNCPLSETIQEEVTTPLGLQSIQYRPLHIAPPPMGNYAPTETCPWRGRALRGEVHDDNAWTMGGVAGHAGLFGTAEDVARFGAAWLNARAHGKWLPRDIATLASSPHFSGRGLGWDFKSGEGSSAGTRLSPSSFGHLGFTGCSLWIDPERHLSVALLTNRVCYGRSNTRIRAFRPLFHDVVTEFVDVS